MKIRKNDNHPGQIVISIRNRWLATIIYQGVVWYVNRIRPFEKKRVHFFGTLLSFVTTLFLVAFRIDVSGVFQELILRGASFAVAFLLSYALYVAEVLFVSTIGAVVCGLIFKLLINLTWQEQPSVF